MSRRRRPTKPPRKAVRDGGRAGVQAHRHAPFLSWRVALALVATGALALRLIYLAQLSETPLFQVLIGDGRQYDSWARQIASGEWLGRDVFYQTPLYPYFLAVLFKVFGHHLLAVRVVQAALGAASCVLLGLAGRAFFNERTGLIAAAFLAVYPPSLFFDGLIQKTSLDGILMTALLALLATHLVRPRWTPIVMSGLVLGLFTLNRENARILYPIVLVWMLIGFRDRPWSTRWRWGAVFTAAATAVILPVAIRNAYVGGEFLISTSQLGPNLYIGNHARARGAYEELVPGHGNAAYEREDATRLAEDAAGRRLSPGEVSEYWTGRALEYVQSNTWSWAQLMMRKLLLTVHRREIEDTESLDAYAGYSSLLRALSWLGLGVVLPVAAAGVWLTRESWRRLAVLYAMFAGFVAATAAFFVLARYRYPIVPIALLFASVPLAALHVLFSARRWLVPAALAAGVAIVCNVPISASPDGTYLNVARALVQSGRASEALPLLNSALSATPDDAVAHFDLGVALKESGDAPSALREFAIAARSRPDYFEAQSALALSLAESGRREDALEHLQRAVQLRPDSPEARINLGKALTDAGRAAEAIVQYETALRLSPNSAAAHNGLGVALQDQGKLQEALAHYTTAVKLDAKSASARNNLALGLAAAGATDAALEQFREALRLAPDVAGTHINLADLLAEAGRLPEAIDEYQQAVKLSPNLLDAHYRLAQAYARAGRLHEAEASLQKALAIATAAADRSWTEQITAALRLVGAGKTPPRGR
jgi:tetratricopeptide (TPR) repeat protein